MALTSYPAPKYTLSPCFSDAADPVDWLSRQEQFTVSPSPCHNGGSTKEPHPYSFTKFVERRMFGKLDSWYYHGDPGRRKRYSNGVWGNVSGYLTPPWPVEESIVRANARDAARNRALSKLYNDIRSSEVNLSTTIGEGRETLEMMAAIAEAVKRPLDALTGIVKRPGFRDYGLAKLSRRQQREWSQKANRVERTSASRTAGLTVSDLWLGWHVGLKPLLHDLESLSLHLKTDKSLDIRYYKKARASEEVLSQDSISADDGTYTFDQYASYRSEIGVAYQVVDMHEFENWRLGLTVRPTLAWELTRLSFVVDYFVEIGDFLQTLEAAVFGNGLQFNGGFETASSLSQVNANFTRKAAETGDGGALNGMTWPVLGEGHASAYRRTTTKARSLLHSFPVSRAPTLKIPTCGAQLLTVAALLSQFLL